MIVDSIAEIAAPSLFLRLSGILEQCPVHLKIEGLNCAGSIKLKTALQIVGDLERTGVLRPGGHIIESSSGNLGLALAVIAASRQYSFTCVGDPNMCPITRRLIVALGARLIIVDIPDKVGGYLQTRLNLIRDMQARDPKLIWTNQYANESNVRAHFRTTGPEILADFPAPDWVFIGAGTTGTITGCARYLREHAPRARIIAVDAAGSVTYGGPAGKRHLPGIGTSRRPEIADESVLHEIALIPEPDALSMCRRMASTRGLLLGASSGSVLAGVAQYSDRIAATDVVIALSPDFGDRYADTVYDEAWVKARFPMLKPPADATLELDPAASL